MYVDESFLQSGEDFLLAIIEIDFYENIYDPSSPYWRSFRTVAWEPVSISFLGSVKHFLSKTVLREPTEVYLPPLRGWGMHLYLLRYLWILSQTFKIVIMFRNQLKRVSTIPRYSILIPEEIIALLEEFVFVLGTDKHLKDAEPSFRWSVESFPFNRQR